MDWKLLLSTFVAIFIAELGDKTQLATLTLATSSSSRWVVFAGAALALVASTAVAVLVGGALGRAIPATFLRRFAGVIFIVLGLAYLFTGEGPSGDATVGDDAETPRR